MGSGSVWSVGACSMFTEQTRNHDTNRFDLEFQNFKEKLEKEKNKNNNNKGIFFKKAFSKLARFFLLFSFPDYLQHHFVFRFLSCSRNFCRVFCEMVFHYVLFRIYIYMFVCFANFYCKLHFLFLDMFLCCFIMVCYFVVQFRLQFFVRDFVPGFAIRLHFCVHTFFFVMHFKLLLPRIFPSQTQNPLFSNYLQSKCLFGSIFP